MSELREDIGETIKSEEKVFRFWEKWPNLTTIEVTLALLQKDSILNSIFIKQMINID